VESKVPAVHVTALVPEYPAVSHVNVQTAPLATAEAEQSVVYDCSFAPPAAMLPVHGPGAQVGATVAAKVPAVHVTALVPEYPVALHVNVQSAPLATAEAEQSVVYALFPAPPAAMLPVHEAA